MAWIRSSSKKSIIIRAALANVRAFLLRIEECGRLMPGVVQLSEVAPGIYHYRLAEVSDGVVRFRPDYEALFDTSDPGEIRWEPHGEHNFRSWGVFRTEPGPVDEEVLLEIAVRAEASVGVNPIMVPVIEPFARETSARITEEFVRNIKRRLEGDVAIEGQDSMQDRSHDIPGSVSAGHAGKSAAR